MSLLQGFCREEMHIFCAGDSVLILTETANSLLGKESKERIGFRAIALEQELRTLEGTRWAKWLLPRKSCAKPMTKCKPLTAFYKGESQEKNFPGDWKEQRCLPGSPAHVMLGGSWGSLFSQIHVAVVTTSSVSDATSSTVAKSANHGSI